MFTKQFGKFVCEGDSITCEVDGFTAMAIVYSDDDPSPPDKRMDGFWPSKDPKAAGYCSPEIFDEEQAKAERAMEAWKKDEWFYCGVDITVSRADVQLTCQYQHALWGIECNYPDSDNNYLTEVANELLDEALKEARGKIKELCACAFEEHLKSA